MPSQPTTRRVQRAEELIQSTEPRERIARCGIRVSMVGNRKKQESRAAKALASKFGYEAQPRPEEREPDFLSPEAQNSVAAAYAAQYGMTYDAEASMKLRDLDSRASKQGSWEKRKGLQQHLKDAQAGLFTDIIFYKLSRLSRNTRDGLLIVKAFHDAGITIHFARDSLNRQIDGKYGELMLMVGFWVNENEIETLGDHISDAIEQKWREGKPHGQPPKWADTEHPEHEQSYQDHRRLVELALQGHTYHGIARTLNDERIKTPRGKIWTSTDISVRLNPRYIKKMMGFAISTPLTDGTEKFVQGLWRPLITQDEADILNLLHNKMLSRRTSALVRPGGKGHSNYASHMLSGTARCAICGHMFSANKGVSGYADTPYFSYMCDKGIWGDPLHVAAGNKKLTIKCDSLDEAVLRVLRLELTLPPPPVTTTARTPRVKPRVTAADVEKKIERAKLRRLDMDIDMYIDLINGLTKERDRLLEEEAQPQRTDLVELALKAAGADEKLQNRALVKAMVADVQFPYYLPGRRKVARGRSEYRAARVILHNKREYMVPIYRDDYRGERAVIPVSASEAFPTVQRTI